MEEQISECVYCRKTLPIKGFYCPSCAKQVRCKECMKSLELDAVACIYCGTEITAKVVTTAKNNQPGMNTIEYHETRSSRSFRAAVSDNVGNSLSGVLGAFVGKGFLPKNVKSKFESNSAIEEGLAEIVDENIKNESVLAIESNSTVPIARDALTSSASPMLTQLLKIFRFDDDKTVLLETRLKAHNKMDYTRRLILLFLQANQLLGKSQVSRNEVVKLLNRTKTGLNDGNTRRWIANNSALTIDEKAHTLEIITEGEELVKGYLQEIENPEVKDLWHITNASKKRKKKKQDTNNVDE